MVDWLVLLKVVGFFGTADDDRVSDGDKFSQ